MKAKERLAKLKNLPTTGLSSLVVGRQLSGHRLQLAVKKNLSPSKVQPNIPPRPRGMWYIYKHQYANIRDT